MANSIGLKRRIVSVKNTKQITKAMEMVSASKMRRAQEQANKTRAYSRMASELLTRLKQLTDVSKHPLFSVRAAVSVKLYVVITSDRGLAGAYNSNVLRLLAKELQKDAANKIKSQVIVVGNQAAQFVSRLKNVEVLAVYTDFVEQPTANDIRPILNNLIDLYKDGEVDAVDIVYTRYKSSIAQEVTTDRLLPVAFAETHSPAELDNAIFEPSPQAVLEGVTMRLVESQLAQIFFESQASEHSMRMMAMKSATDNANDLVDDLTLAFNTARQASITQELAEITGGAAAIK